MLVVQAGLAIMFAVTAGLAITGYLVIERLPDEVFTVKQGDS